MAKGKNAAANESEHGYSNLSGADHNLIIKILKSEICRLDKIETKATKEDDTEIANAAATQRAKVEALQTKLL